MPAPAHSPVTATAPVPAASALPAPAAPEGVAAPARQRAPAGVVTRRRAAPRARAAPAASSAQEAASAALLRRIRSALRKTFGHTQLRAGQQAVIERVLAGRSTLALMPTGAGKSLCYQLPATLLSGRTVVVSPLIALMQDQCEAMAELGIACVQVNSALDSSTLQAAERAIADGSARVVLTTPERLADPAFQALLRQQPTSLLVVDEAHCISQWGHDFRPAFLEIAPALRTLGNPPVLALTATATQHVLDDVLSQLGIAKSGVVHTGVYRPHLHFAVEQVERESDKPARLLALVAGEEAGHGIVYTATVKAAEEVHQALRAADVNAGLYHGRLPAAERQQAQEAFMDGSVRVMVATNAFGLGIDKSDIRFVVHYQMPASLDAYYQEAGRAGRDGAPATCTLLFLRSDRAVQQFFLGGRYPGLDDVEALYSALLRSAPDGAAAWTLEALQSALERPRSKLQVALSALRRQRIARQDAKGQIRLLKTTLQAEEVQQLVHSYTERRVRDRATLEEMVDYAQSGQCRWQRVLQHFAPEAAHPRCATCDNCQRLAAAQQLADQQAQRRTAPPLPARPQRLPPVQTAAPVSPVSPVSTTATTATTAIGATAASAGRRTHTKDGTTAAASAASDTAATAAKAAQAIVLRAGMQAACTGTGTGAGTGTGTGTDSAYSMCLGTCAPGSTVQPAPSSPAPSAVFASGAGTAPGASVALATSPVAFAPGDPVRARRHGKGVVVASDALSVTVAFDGGVQRAFHPAFLTRARTVSRRAGAPGSARPPRAQHVPVRAPQACAPASAA